MFNLTFNALCMEASLAQELCWFVKVAPVEGLQHNSLFLENSPQPLTSRLELNIRRKAP